jgi:predicted amidophosphoribosyltransferase
MITSLKYRSASCLIQGAFVPLLKRYRREFKDPWPWAGLSSLTIVPAPLDARRKRERGLDHANLLAQAIQETFIPWATIEPLLIRKKSVLPNASLHSDDLRYANITGAMEATRSLAGEDILLVDDVLTTGATALEAARALRAQGAGEIHLFTMAIGRG